VVAQLCSHRFMNELFAGSGARCSAGALYIQDHRFSTVSWFARAALASAETFAARCALAASSAWFVGRGQTPISSGGRSAGVTETRAPGDLDTQPDPLASRDRSCAKRGDETAYCARAFESSWWTQNGCISIGPPRARSSPAANKFVTSGVDHAARQFEFAALRRFPLRTEVEV